VCYQGAAVFNTADGAILQQTPLPQDVTRDVLRKARADRFHAQCYADDRLYVDEINRFSTVYTELARVEPVVVPSLIEAFADRPSLKIVLVDTAERATAQAKLESAGNWSGSAGGQPAANWDRAPKANPGAGNWDTAWDPTLPAIPSAFVGGDPIAIINTILGYASTSAQVTQQMGHNFLQQLGLVPTPSGYTNGAIPRVYGQQASEYVIRRAQSQIGVPYSWGGGTAAGPSTGIDSGSGTVGFDCSGLILYAFAGVGIKLDHYSGSQYNAGRKIPSSQMRRGDMIFYGPNASQHVAMYLGDGQMLEAPYTGSVVKISPVRSSGMTPYATRLIEW